MDTRITVEPVATRADMDAFIRLPWQIYRNDPNWVPPLIIERRAFLDPKRNPFFDHATVRLWLARKGTRPVGRISAQVNRAHLDRYRDATGHFGLLEAEDDEAVFAGLLAAAADWLTAQDMRRVIGPASFSVNDEWGLLVDGFDTPPMILMGHARPYYAPRLEQQGFVAVKDLYSYRYLGDTEVPPGVAAFLEKALRAEAVAVRPVDMRKFRAELMRILDIFNDAWSDNWGYVPMTDAEISHTAKELKPILSAKAGAIAEIDGRPVAMAVALPNVNEAIADLDGRLLPFGLAKLLWRIKVKSPRTVRMPLMGVRKAYQGTPLGAALAYAVINQVRRAQIAAGAEMAELSWILEDNQPMIRMIEQMGGRRYKTYRLYQRSLA